MKKIDKQNFIFCIFSLLFSALYIKLGCIPNGIRMDFFGGYVSYYPYFSAMPYGYGNIFPLFIEILAIVNIILLVITIFVQKKGLQVTRIVFPSVILVFCLAEFFFTTSVTAVNIAMFDIAFAHVAYEVLISIFKKFKTPTRQYPTYEEFCKENGLDPTSTQLEIRELTDED